MNLKVRGLTGTWGAIDIEMPKFEAKREIFQTFGKTGGRGGCSLPAPPSMRLLKTFIG